MYKSIEQQINELNTRNNKVLLIGDFNSKIGNMIKNNNSHISNGGKMLNDLIEKTNCHLINGT